MLLPYAIFEDGSAQALAGIKVEVLILIASGAAIATAIAQVPVKESGDTIDEAAIVPRAGADASTASVIKDEMLVAGSCRMDASACPIIPSIAARAWGPKASAAADSEGVVEVVADGAWLLVADALRAVPELAAGALTGLGDPSAVDFVPVLAWKAVTVGQTDAFVSPVVVVEASSAIKNKGTALAPGFFPVELVGADLGLAKTVTPGSVEVEATRAGLGVAEAAAMHLVPVQACQAALVHLDTAARAVVPSPADVVVRVQRVAAPSSVSGTINWHALASTGPFVPVAVSDEGECVGVSHRECCALLRRASAVASGHVPLQALRKAVDWLDAHTLAVKLRPECVCGAHDRRASAAACILIPDSARSAHQWAALAGAGVVVPDLPIDADAGTANAGAS